MSFNLTKLTRAAIATAFRLGPPLVRAGVYYRPPAHHAGSGALTSAEIVVPCSFISSAVRSSAFLGLARVLPGAETILIRSSELTEIASPGQGDYIVEADTGLRWNIEAARLDPAGVFYLAQTMRSIDEDWGDLTGATVAGDWADLSPATEFEDRLALT